MNEEFTSYISRHLTGFLLLKDYVEAISIAPMITEVYGKTYCRLYIDVSVKDQDYPIETKRLFNKYFHNTLSATGSQFVSVEVKGTGYRENSIKILKQFYDYYVSITGVLKESLPSILKSDTHITIKDIDSIPIFPYVVRFWREFNIGEVEYKTVFGRTLEQDARLHDLLKDQAKEFESYAGIEGTITDIELVKASACKSSEIRDFIVINDLPISISRWGKTIDEIYIDTTALGKALDKSIPGYYTSFDVDKIKHLIKAKQLEKIEENSKEEQKQKLINSFPIKPHDIILSKDGKISSVESISLTYSGLRVKHKELKNDFTLNQRIGESEIKEIKKCIPFGKYQEILAEKEFINKNALVLWLKKVKEFQFDARPYEYLKHYY